jgi:hypothetical protein
LWLADAKDVAARVLFFEGAIRRRWSSPSAFAEVVRCKPCPTEAAYHLLARVPVLVNVK